MKKIILPDNNAMSLDLCRYISETLLDEKVRIDPDTVLSHIGIDSSSIIEIILYIERKYGVIIPEDMLTPENFKSVNAIADCAIRFESRTKRN